MIATVVNDTARTAPWLIDLAPLEAMVILEPPILIAFLTARWNAFLAAANMVCDSINDLVERRNGFRVLSNEKGPYSVDWVSREREGLICKTHKGNDCGDGRKREGVRCETHGTDGRRRKPICEQCNSVIHRISNKHTSTNNYNREVTSLKVKHCPSVPDSVPRLKAHQACRPLRRRPLQSSPTPHSPMP